MANQTDQPDRELDVLVAEKVMGQIPCDRWTEFNLGSAGGPALLKNCDHENCYSTLEIGSAVGPVGGVPRYSSKIHAAWEVVERMQSLGYDLTLESDSSGKEWCASFRQSSSVAAENSFNESSMPGRGDSAEMAICLASLEALIG